MRSPIRLLPLVLISTAGCGGCGAEEKANAVENTRLWGRDKLAADVAARAEMPLDARAATEDATVRARILEMPFEEVVARIGFATYRGRARFTLERNEQRVDVFEDTLIEQALHGSWRVLQRDEDGDVLREKVYSNGLFYSRNGNGQLRLDGVADKPGSLTRQEAFEPLSAFTAWFGPRLALSPAGSGLSKGRAVVKYKLSLGAGPELVEDPRRPGKRLKPRSLSGELRVDADTGAPMGAQLKGRLDVEPPPGGTEWGRLSVDLDFTIAPRSGDPLVVTDAVPPIERRPKDLDPLGFLERKTRTSTVIGGSN